MSEKNKNKEKLAEVIKFEKAKKKIVLKKTATQKLQKKMFGTKKNRVLYFPLKSKNIGCPKCKNVSLDYGDPCSLRCRTCGWCGARKGECPHCHGDVVISKSKCFCVQCRTEFSQKDQAALLLDHVIKKEP